MTNAEIYVHIYEDGIRVMAFKDNKGKGFQTIKDARNWFESPIDRVNCKVETIYHAFETLDD